MKRKETRGGYRPNSGRKPSGNAKEIISVRYDAKKIKELKELYTGHELADKIREALDTINRNYKVVIEEDGKLTAVYRK